jgi:hypothetical protein
VIHLKMLLVVIENMIPIIYMKKTTREVGTIEVEVDNWNATSNAACQRKTCPLC